MIHCIYNTDSEWINVLRENGQKRLNFWRKDIRPINLNEGDQFYFRVRGTEFIAGKATFIETKLQTISEAWIEFGLGNGVASLEVFQSRAKELLKLNTENIRSIVL